MRKIKLIRIYDHGYSDDYDDYIRHIVQDGSDWNEVSDEDFNFISSNLYLLNRRNKFDDGRYAIIEMPEIEIPTLINNIKDELNKIKKQQEKEEAERLRKKEEAAQKRAEKKLLRDKKALEKLIKENPTLLEKLKNA